ncbi:MAG: Rab family GTPase [Promethearchaeota archaeon]
MNDKAKKFLFKITVIGDGQVGKTSLIKRFTKSDFKKDYVKTIGAQFSTYEKEIEGVKIRLLFWDIAGQDDFNFLRPSFFKNSKAAIIVYSLEETELGEDSFEHIPDWFDDIQQFCGDIPVILFANKVDLVDEQNLDHSKIQKMMNKYNLLKYFITSAKTGQGVIEAFNTIIDNLYHKYKALSSVL